MEGNWEKGGFGVRVGLCRRASGATQPLSHPRGEEVMCSSGVSGMQGGEAAVPQVTLSPDAPGRLINGSYFTMLGCSLLWHRDIRMVFPARGRFPGMLGAGGGSRCTSRLAPHRNGTSGSRRPRSSPRTLPQVLLLGTEQSPVMLPSRQSRIPHRAPLPSEPSL